jgi:hypothetical protein
LLPTSCCLRPSGRSAFCNSEIFTAALRGLFAFSCTAWRWRRMASRGSVVGVHRTATGTTGPGWLGRDYLVQERRSRRCRGSGRSRSGHASGHGRQQRARPAATRPRNHAGGGTRTPDTRIMIPLLFRSTAPFDGAAGLDRETAARLAERPGSATRSIATGASAHRRSQVSRDAVIRGAVRPYGCRSDGFLEPPARRSCHVPNC